MSNSPGFRFAHPGDELQTSLHCLPLKEGRRSADRRTFHDRATLSDVAICECFGRGRGLIGDRSPLGAPPRRLPRKLMPWLSPGRVSWDVRQSGRYPTAAVPVQRGTSRTGRNAGRLDTRTAREQGYKPCPQEPHPPHRSAATGRRPFEGRDLPNVTKKETMSSACLYYSVRLVLRSIRATPAASERFSACRVVARRTLTETIPCGFPSAFVALSRG